MKLTKFKLKYILIYLTFLLVLVEISCYIVVTKFFIGKGIIYVADIPSMENQENYDRIVNRLTGWPNKDSYGKEEYNLIGARKSGIFPEPSFSSCISIYGDSFVWADGVSYREAWPDLLAEKLNCRVNNFGVTGFGTDQVYLRMKYNVRDVNNDFIILGFLDENIIRNVNQFRALLYGGYHGFKPVFLKDNEELRRVPLPDVNKNNFIEVYKNPKNFFRHDFFLKESDFEIKNAGFPYILSFFKAITHPKFTNFFDKGSVYYRKLYEKDHPSGAYGVTINIMKKFAQLSEKRNSSPIILFIPTASELHQYAETSTWTAGEIMKAVREADIEYINLGVKIYDYILNNDIEICDLYERSKKYKNGCSGHFNVFGNQVIAELMYDVLKKSIY